MVYPLPELPLVAPCATPGGAENFVGIEERGEDRPAFLRRFLPYRRGIASHDTLTNVMKALDTRLFTRAVRR